MSHAVVLCGGVSLTCLMLFYVGSFSYTPHVISCGVSLTHSCSSMWEVSLTRSLLFYVGGGGGWGGGGNSLTWSMLFFIWGVSFTWPMLFYVGNFSYTLRAVYLGFSLTLLVLIFMQEVCFPCPMLFDIRNFSYTSYASLCGEIF